MSARVMKRRDAAAGGIAMLVLAAAAAGQAKAEELDGELLALVAEFKAREPRFLHLNAIGDECGPASPEGRAAQAEIRTIVDRGWEIRDRVSELIARTPEGLAAKAWLALWETSDGSPGEGPPVRDDMAVAWSLARDVLGRAGA